MDPTGPHLLRQGLSVRREVERFGFENKMSQDKEQMDKFRPISVYQNVVG